MLIDVVVLAFTWIILTRGRSVVQDHSSDHRFKRLHLTRASVRRASGFVLTGYAEVKALLSLTIPESGSYSAWVRPPR